MNYESIKFQSDYKGGMSFDTHSTRTYEFTIISEEYKSLNGRRFIREVYTERDIDGFYGKSKATYYINNQSKVYKSVKWLLKSMLKEHK